VGVNRISTDKFVWEIKYEDRPTEYLEYNPGISAGEGTGILSVRSVLTSEIATIAKKKQGTMNRDKLVEALLPYCAMRHGMTRRQSAAAVIDLVLKEAAKVARALSVVDWEDGDGGEYGHGFENAAIEIADEIIALTSKGNPNG